MGNEIDFEELKYKNRDDFVIIDIRDAVSFEYGHIPGSINIPYNEVVERVKKFNEKKELYIHISLAELMVIPLVQF